MSDESIVYWLPKNASFSLFSNMKYFICLFAVIAVASAFPQREGAQFTNEAIQQAQNSYLIPRDAQIQNVCQNNFIIKTTEIN